MANRFPLIANSSANQIQELASGDNLDLTGNDITGVSGINASGIITATGGFNIGINSAGSSVASGPVKTFNFVGAGNTFLYNAGTDTIDISIAGGGGGATGGGDDKIFYENDVTVTTDYELTASTNAMSAGPILINNGVTVTIPSGQFWTIV